MSNPIKKPNQTNPENYSPEIPKFLNMMDELYTEKVIDTVVTEGVEFTIIEKGITLYAGAYAVEPDMELNPNFDPYRNQTDVSFLFGERQTDEEIKAIRNSVTPDRIIVLNIDYTTDGRLCAMLRGQETINREQPEGIHIIEAEPTLLIKVEHTHAAFELTKKLTGKYIHQYQISELFGLIKHIFCESEYAEYEVNGDNGSGNSDAEHYSVIKEGEGHNGNGYVTVPVKRKAGNTSGEIKKDMGISKNAGIVQLIAPRTVQDIEAMQITPKEFKKLKFGGRDWLVLDEKDNKALIMSETVESRRYHYSERETIWADCELRGYLNSEFYDTFSQEEKARIIKTKLPPCYFNPWHGPGGGKARVVQMKEKNNNPPYSMEVGKGTDDHIFLLSIEELIKYTGDSGDLEKRVGWYWGGGDINNMLFSDGMGQVLYDQYNTARIAKNANGEASWWRLRSPGCLYRFTVVVSPIGAIIVTGTPHSENGIRPAMWVNL